ncbi:DNA primase [Leptothrix ochracea]|uniref:DNA primase n=1 Tax=Leptothrix ochracea TaxID=735331 RepID=UPI0034E24D21
MIPPAFLQDLLSRTDIVSVVGRTVQLKKAGINYKGLCPFHGEKSPSFVVSPTRQTYHCFGCGVHGNAVGFLMEQSGLGFIDAVKDLAREVGMNVPEEESSPAERARAAEEKSRRITLTEVMSRAGDHYRAELKASPRAIAYLKGRGLSGEIAARFGLGYAPAGPHSLASAFGQYDDPLLIEAGLVIHRNEEGEDGRRYDRFRDRIMFPIRNVQGETIGFGGRVLDRGEPKYLNSPETPLFVKGRELYGLFEARSALREHGHVLVTEGYMDVVALAQLGFANAVATLGTACTADHVAKLCRFTDQVVFSFDGDAAGRRAAVRAMEAALPHAQDTRSFKFLFLPTEHDPDSFVRTEGADAFRERVAAAVPLSLQMIEVASADCDLASVEGRARLIAQAEPLWRALPEGVLRLQMVAEFARSARMETSDLGQRWGTEKPQRTKSRSAPYDGTHAARPPLPMPMSRGSMGGRQPLIARRPEDRAATLLLQASHWWSDLSDADHTLLCELPDWHGELFRWLDQWLMHDDPAPWSILQTHLQDQPWASAAHPLVEAALRDGIPPMQEDLPPTLQQIRRGDLFKLPGRG